MTTNTGKNGWYSNPNDRHLFVQSRMNSTSYSMNMARPAAKWWVAVTGVICVAAIGVCLFIAVLFGQLEHASQNWIWKGTRLPFPICFMTAALPLMTYRKSSCWRSFLMKIFPEPTGSHGPAAGGTF